MEIDFANKIDADLHKRVKSVAADRGMNMKIALDQALRVWLDKEYQDPDAELGARLLRMWRTAEDPTTKAIAKIFIDLAKEWRG